jgi:hypothetical protein
MKKILGMMLLLYPMVSNAATWAEVEIANIRAFTDQTAHYLSVTDFTNPQGCSSTAEIVLNRDDTDNWKMVHTILLTGFISGSSVKVRTTGCSGGRTVIDGALLIKDPTTFP